jgi:peptidyl-tRNA hydrolase, PTH1 family
MKLFVGLGNPGEKYKKTRHNVGFMFLDYWAEFLKLSWKLESKHEVQVAKLKSIILIKPQTYMNDSGRAVRKVIDYNRLGKEDLILIYDDLDVAFGEYKISMGKSPRTHNGVNSVVECLSGEDFLHVRIGSGGEWFEEYKKKMNSVADDYILKDFSKKEEKELAQIFEKVLKSINDWPNLL